MSEKTAEETAIHNVLLSLFCWVDIQDGIPAESRIFVNARETIDRCIRAAVKAETDRCERAIETRFRAEERKLEERNKLHGGPTARTGQAVRTPLIQESADIAACRLMAVAAIRAEPDAGEGEGGMAKRRKFWEAPREKSTTSPTAPSDLVGELQAHHEKVIDGEEYCEACGSRWPCAAIRAAEEIDRLTRELESERETTRGLRGALEFYGDESNYTDDGVPGELIRRKAKSLDKWEPDNGQIARAALPAK